MNFAIVDRLDVVAALIGQRGCWGETVEYEVSKWQNDPAFSSLSNVHGFMASPLISTEAEQLRTLEYRKKFVKQGDGPRKHMGEAETLALIESRYDPKLTVVFTEDKPTIVQCGILGTQTAGTRAVLVAAATLGILSWQEADDIAVAVVAKKRPVLAYPPAIRQPIPFLGQ